ncbi:MAG TPA: NnrU family protein [Caulobacteraceae bacterium]|jgi:protein-S-isoprenylcysteine O-methyltransferase Ste14|nr:NnrU family protein [Caulobacteraceae bacterium]
MTRVFGAAYSAIVYLVFLASFLYAIPFLGDFLVAKTVDSAPPGSAVVAVIVDMLLLGVFAVQHSVMARPAFKRAWTRVVPVSLERSTYVLAASLALVLAYWQWRSLPAVVWNVSGPLASVLWVVFFAGWGLVLLSTFLIDHFELFGLRQGFGPVLGLPEYAPSFKSPSLYRLVRHPIYLGFVLALWGGPHMSVGRLLFAAGSTGYILIGIWFEERDLVGLFGDQYRDYRRRVAMLIPWPKKAA